MYCTLTEEHKPTGRVLMVVCGAHQDVCCSPRFLLVLQTPGGPHKEGKSYSTVLHDTHSLNLTFVPVNLCIKEAAFKMQPATDKLL